MTFPAPGSEAEEGDDHREDRHGREKEDRTPREQPRLRRRTTGVRSITWSTAFVLRPLPRVSACIPSSITPGTSPRTSRIGYRKLDDIRLHEVHEGEVAFGASREGGKAREHE